MHNEASIPKEYIEFPDLPFDEQFLAKSDLVTLENMDAYFRARINNAQMRDRIQFRHTVKSVVKRPDGKFDVTVRYKNKERQHVFEYVIVDAQKYSEPVSLFLKTDGGCFTAQKLRDPQEMKRVKAKESFSSGLCFSSHIIANSYSLPDLASMLKLQVGGVGTVSTPTG